MRIQQLVGKSTISGLLRCLDDREGIVGEENLGEFLPHRRPVDDETRGERPDSFRIRADYCPSQKDGASYTHLVIMRDVQTPDCTSRAVDCCQNRNEVRTVDVVERAFLVASESPKKLIDSFKVLGPILRVHDRQGDGVSMGRLHLSLCQQGTNAQQRDVSPDDWA